MTDVESDVSGYFGCGLRIDAVTREFFTFDDPRFVSIASDPEPSEPPVFPSAFRILSVLGTNNQRCAIPGAQQLHGMSPTSSSNRRTNVGLRVGNVTARVRYVAIYRF